MSRENVEIAMRIYEAISRGDTPLDLLHPALEWETSPNLPDAGVYRGRERVTAFLEEQANVVWGGPPSIEVEASFDAGEDVVLFIRVRGTGSHSGVGLDVQIAHVLTLREGRLVRGRVFPDRRKALEAVGLRE